MAIPSDIMQEFGVTPDASATESNDSGDWKHPLLPDLIDTSDSGIEDRINRLYGQQESNKPAASPEKPVNKNSSAEQNPVEKQPAPAVPSNPTELFEKGSSKAFFTESGEPDSQKINDYFLTNGKSFLKYANVEPVQDVEPVKPVEKLDPEKEYGEKMRNVFENYSDLFNKEIAGGRTFEEAANNLYVQMERIKQEYNQKKELYAAIAEQAKQMAPEIEESRAAKLDAKVFSNVTELSAGLENLISGMSATQVLDQFCLNPKYGGSELDRMILKDIPNLQKMPEQEKKSATVKWFKNFQADKAALAHVAEFGRLRWQVEHFKPLLEHAQQVGAGKVSMRRETVAGGPSNLTMPQKADGNSKLEQWFNGGVDSVN